MNMLPENVPLISMLSPRVAASPAKPRSAVWPEDSTSPLATIFVPMRSCSMVILPSTTLAVTT